MTEFSARSLSWKPL